jgi:hypothetical protein
MYMASVFVSMVQVIYVCMPLLRRTDALSSFICRAVCKMSVGQIRQNLEVVHNIKMVFDEPSWGTNRSQVMAQSLLMDSDATFFPHSPTVK